MKAIYYNADLDIRINFNGDRFCILGDDEQVSDEVLFDLFEGKPVDGWELVS